MAVRPDAPQLAALVGGLAVLVGTLLPWYVADLREVFKPQSASGLSSGTAPKVAFALAIVMVLAGAALVADARGALPLDRGLASLLNGVVLVCAVICAVIIGYRLIAAPPELNSRRYGIYIAAAGAALALTATIRQILRR